MALSSSLTLLAFVTVSFVAMPAAESNIRFYSGGVCTPPTGKMESYFTYDTDGLLDPMKCSPAKEPDQTVVSLQFDCSAGVTRATMWKNADCSGAASGSVCFDAATAPSLQSRGACVEGKSDTGDTLHAVTQWTVDPASMVCTGSNTTGSSNTTGGSGRRLAAHAACTIGGTASAKASTSKSGVMHSLFVMLSVMAVGLVKLLVEV